MNIVRAVLRGIVATAFVAGCSSDGGSGSGTTSSPLSKCATGATTTDACQSCIEASCGTPLDKCWGKNFSGGACKALATCAEKASDPCNADCTPDDACTSCLTGDLAPCVESKCATECKGQTGSTSSGGCADLAVCCAKISDPGAKGGCENTASAGNENVCSAYYASLRSFCEE